MTLPPEEVCSDQSYYDKNGAKQVGTKDCQGPAECTSNGETGCVTNTQYQAADLSNLNAASIVAGVSIAGVNGTMIPEAHADCNTDGQEGCVTTAAFKAADMSA